jgi:hypothetical protein
MGMEGRRLGSILANSLRRRDDSRTLSAEKSSVYAHLAREQTLPISQD